MLVKLNQVDFSSNKGRTRYSYASLGDVASQVAAGLAEHGLSHGWDIEQSQAIGQLPGMVTVTCTLTHEWGHGESVVDHRAARRHRQQEQHPADRLGYHVPGALYPHGYHRAGGARPG